MAFQLSEETLNERIQAVRARIKAEQAKRQDMDRGELRALISRHVERELQETLHDQLQTLATARANAAKRLADARATTDAQGQGGDQEAIRKAEQEVARYPMPSAAEEQAERERATNRALAVLEGEFKVLEEPTPATAPATPETVIRAAPQLKSARPPSSIKPFVQPGGIVLPSHQIPGAAESTLVLGVGLGLITLWPTVKVAVVDRMWNGKQTALPVPPSGIISLALFLGALVLAASMSEDLAQITLWIVLALWVVLLVKRPEIVTTAASFLSQGASTVVPVSSASTPTGPPSPQQKGPS